MTQPTLSPDRERYLLLVLAGIQFCHIVDFMIMMPLGPTLISTLAIDTHQFGLLVSAYTFSAAVTGLLAAAGVDRFERKRLLLLTFCLFAAATLACGLAPGFYSLMVARCAAGAFGGILGAMVQTIIGDLIPYERRGQATGTVMSAFALATVAGVPLSLLLANQFGWRAPFFFIALLALPFGLLGWRQIPLLRGHLDHAVKEEGERDHPLAAMAQVLADRGQQKALAVMGLMTFGGFTIIPYITLYVTRNVGLSLTQVPFIYVAGGCATLLTSRLIGRWSDRYGKLPAYRLLALASLLPLFSQTHLPPLPLWAVLFSTTTFFVLISGRMIPAMALLTSAAQPRLRGTFLALAGSLQQLSSGLAAYLGGALISQSADGRILNYGTVGFVAMGATLLTIVLMGRIPLHQAPKPNGP